ncbi:MAG: M48 family metallopeptidase [Luteolibacter sp.]
MDFFETQRQARSRARMLIPGFILCVFGVVAALYLIAMSIMPLVERHGRGEAFQWWNSRVALGVGVPVIVLVVGGTIWKIASLRGGGSSVALSLGALPVSPDTQDEAERRFLNVVQEMALAAGIPVPDAWVMREEKAINAFAAGRNPSEAVVVVTRGALDHLDRDELQAVVGHEFSHIVNGDMPLNHRLIGLVFGLVIISLTGRGLLRVLNHVRGSNAWVLAGMALGGILWLVGAIGVFFARLLQCSVSRQRELLADAASVQFTRNPSAMARALKKVGGTWRRGALFNLRAVEARHVFFVSSDTSGLKTHPELEQRIRALEADWDGKFIQLDFSPAQSRAKAWDPKSAPDSDALIDRWRKSASLLVPQEARLVVLAMAGAFESDAQVPPVAAALEKLGPSRAFAVLEAALNPLKLLPRPELVRMITAVRSTLAAAPLTWRGVWLQQLLERRIAPLVGLMSAPAASYRSLGDLYQETSVILSALDSESGDGTALGAVIPEYVQHVGAPFMPPGPEERTPDHVAAALQAFWGATPMVKSQLMRLCRLAVESDGVVNEREELLMRAVSVASGLPLPAGWMTGKA